MKSLSSSGKECVVHFCEQQETFYFWHSWINEMIFSMESV